MKSCKEIIQINRFFFFLHFSNNFEKKNQTESAMLISNKCSIYLKKNKNFLILKLGRKYPEECVTYMQYFAKKEKNTTTSSH